MSAPQGFDRELYANMLAGIEGVCARHEAADDGLLDYMVRLTPGYRRPNHFAELAARAERGIVEGGVRLLSHGPPRHGKTEMQLALVPWAWRRRPKMEFLYVAYGAALAESKSRRAMELARAAGFTITKDAASEWCTAEGGTFRATSIGGPATGQGADQLLFDDFFKNRAEAESAAARKNAFDWIAEVGLQRLSPNASVWVNAARWHVDDPSGRLQKMGWEYLRFPAIEESGLAAYDEAKRRFAACTDHEEALELAEEVRRAKAALRPLWPEQWSVDALLERRRIAGESSWLSLQQGSPRPRGGKVFRDVYTYAPEDFPALGRDAMGVDLAYTRKTTADWSIGVWGRRQGTKIYVREAIRDQTEPRIFVPRLGLMQRSQHRPMPARWYTSTTERGVADLAGAHGLDVHAQLASVDKLMRAEPYAGGWNEGNVLLPADAPGWTEWFIESHLDFTGVGDEEDDPVDAGAAMYDQLVPEMVAREDHGRRQNLTEQGSDMRFGGMSDRRGY